MTSVEIVEEIERLPRAEQARVIDFVRNAGEARRLTPDELGELARKMVEAKDPNEADRLQTGDCTWILRRASRCLKFAAETPGSAAYPSPGASAPAKHFDMDSAASNGGTVEEYVAGVLAGDRAVLSRAVTLIESQSPLHEKKAQKVLQSLLPHTGKARRIGITGAPGVGKSTFIEAFGCT